MLLLTLLPLVGWAQTLSFTSATYDGSSHSLPTATIGSNTIPVSTSTYVTYDGYRYRISEWTYKSNPVSQYEHAGTYIANVQRRSAYYGSFADYTTLTLTVNQATNGITDFKIDDYAVGETPSTPTCTPKFGTASYQYGPDPIVGPWSTSAPTTGGNWYVRATVAGNDDYAGVEAAIAFKVASKATATGLSLQSGLTYNDGKQSLISGTPSFPADYETSAGGIEYIVKATDAVPGYAETGADAAEAEDAGLYYVFYRVKGDGDLYIDGNWTQVGSTGVKISKRAITADDFTFAAVSGDLTFNEAAQKLAELTWTNDKDRGTVEYTVNGGPAVAVAEGTDAKTYTVTATITPDGNHTFAGTITSVEKKIDKATVVFDKDDVESTIVASQTYTGSALNLLKGMVPYPEFNGHGWSGTYTYYIDGVAVVGDHTAVQKTDAGEYVVTFDFEPANANVQFTAGTQTVGTAKINKAANSITNTPALVSDKVYNAAAQELIKTEPTATFGTVKYYIEDETTAITTAADVKKTDAGEYKVYYEVDGGNNYESIAKTQFPGNLGTIKPAEILVTAQKFDKTYDQVAVDKKNFFLGKNFVGGETPEKQLEILEQLVKVEGYDKTEAGSYTVTLSAVSPAPANNYKVDEVWVAETKLTIAPAPIK